MRYCLDMKTTTNPAATLLNFLTLLTILAASAVDAEDAADQADFFWQASPGALHHEPDGRVLLHW